MYYLPIIQPWPAQQNMACIHGYNVTPKLILVALTNGQGNKAP